MSFEDERRTGAAAHPCIDVASGSARAPCGRYNLQLPRRSPAHASCEFTDNLQLPRRSPALAEADRPVPQRGLLPLLCTFQASATQWSLWATPVLAQLVMTPDS